MVTGNQNNNKDSAAAIISILASDSKKSLNVKSPKTAAVKPEKIYISKEVEDAAKEKKALEKKRSKLSLRGIRVRGTSPRINAANSMA